MMVTRYYFIDIVDRDRDRRTFMRNTYDGMLLLLEEYSHYSKIIITHKDVEQ